MGPAGTESNGPMRMAVRIANPQGLHIRPAAAFAEAAQRFQSVVTVYNGETGVDGKVWVDLLLLAAECGTELIVEARGPDAADALPVLTGLLAAVPADEPT